MQANPTIQEVKCGKNNYSWNNTEFRSTPKDYKTNHQKSSEMYYSWRDIQGLSWIFEEEVYDDRT